MRDRNQGRLPPIPKPSSQAMSGAQRKIWNAIKKRANEVLELNKVILDAVGKLKKIREEVLTVDPQYHAFWVGGPIPPTEWLQLPFQSMRDIANMEHNSTQNCLISKRLIAKKAASGCKARSKPRKN